MSVLSRPVLHRATAPTQREARIPLPRSASSAQTAPRTSSEVRTPAPRTSAPTARRRIPPALLALGLAGALAVAGGTTYLLADGGGDDATVIAPAFEPSAADLARDRAAAARGAVDGDVLTPGEAQSQRDAARQDVAPPFFLG